MSDRIIPISISRGVSGPFEQRAIIKVCGIGGGGDNAVGRMIQDGLKDVEFITINTDAQALRTSPAGTRLQIGGDNTGGLGSGADPTRGAEAAMSDKERIREVLDGADMVFLTAGMGGGTGTGASPIVAEAARGTGALTVAIVTLPFSFEGKERMENAVKGLALLEEQVDTLIVIPNDRVATLCQSNMSFLNAFRQADEVLHNGVRAISELITIPGLINLDFADVRTIMKARGRALMGIGTAEGDNRAQRAAQEAIVCPLLEQSNITGARGVIVNIRGGCDIGMREVQDAVTTVQQAAHPDANIIFGAVIDDDQRPELSVTVIAAGFPKGVSEDFLNSDGSVNFERARTALDELSELPPLPAPKANPVKPAPVTVKTEVAAAQAPQKTETETDQEQEELFPPGAEESQNKPVETGPYLENDDTDINIPAFMRKRKKY